MSVTPIKLSALVALGALAFVSTTASAQQQTDTPKAAPKPVVKAASDTAKKADSTGKLKVEATPVTPAGEAGTGMEIRMQIQMGPDGSMQMVPADGSGGGQEFQLQLQGLQSGDGSGVKIVSDSTKKSVTTAADSSKKSVTTATDSSKKTGQVKVEQEKGAVLPIKLDPAQLKMGTGGEVKGEVKSGEKKSTEKKSE